MHYNIYKPIYKVILDRDYLIIDYHDLSQFLFNSIDPLFNSIDPTTSLMGIAQKLDIDCLVQNGITPDKLEFWIYVQNYLEFNGSYKKVAYMGSFWESDEFMNNIFIHAKNVCDSINIISLDGTPYNIDFPKDFIKSELIHNVRWFTWTK